MLNSETSFRRENENADAVGWVGVGGWGQRSPPTLPTELCFLWALPRAATLFVLHSLH